jgi:hypothetical protein
MGMNMSNHEVKNSFTPVIVVCLVVIPFILGFPDRDDQKDANRAAADTVRYSEVVAPVIQRYCLPCHSEDEENPSGLSLDTYDNLMKGGRHGSAVIAGNPGASPLLGKLSSNPPFGDPMPLRSRKRIPPDTVELIRKWILQGARNR